MIGSLALIIEGHALDKLLGDVPNPIVEEILHSFASSFQMNMVQAHILSLMSSI